jgi:hypothetical protein
MRRIAISSSGLLALAITFLTTTPAAFAMRVIPPDGASTPVTTSRVVHQAGLGFWQVSLIVIASAVVLSVAVWALVIRGSRRSAPSAAIS